MSIVPGQGGTCRHLPGRVTHLLADSGQYATSRSRLGGRRPRLSRPGSTPSASGGTTRWSKGCGPRGAASRRSPATWAGARTPSSVMTAPPPGTNSLTAAGGYRARAGSTCSSPTCPRTRTGAAAAFSACSVRSRRSATTAPTPVVRDYLARHRPAREQLPPAPRPDPRVRRHAGRRSTRSACPAGVA